MYQLQKIDTPRTMQWRIQGFSQVGAPTPKIGMKSYYLVNFIFSQKLHEIERIWTPRRASVPGAPLTSANAMGVSNLHFYSMMNGYQ